jgi:hypothetical protein
LEAMLQLAVGEDFDPDETTSDKIRIAQKLFIYDSARLKSIEVTEVHNSVMLVKRCVIKSAFRQSPNQGHLSAFKAEADAPTRARFLPFVALPAGFPVA